MINRDSRGDLTYDVDRQGRYHFETLRIRTQAAGLARHASEEILEKKDLQKDDTALRRISPALDFHRATPGDVAHSELKGIGRQIIEFLFNNILKNVYSEPFSCAFAALPIPHGWPRNQHLLRHLGSYSIQEYGRETIMMPIVLRRFLHPEGAHIRPDYLSAVDSMLTARGDTHNLSAVNFIVHCYTMIAKSNTLFLGAFIRNEDRVNIHQIAIEARERYQDLIAYAVHAAVSGSRDRHTSPAPVVGNPSSRFSSPCANKSPTRKDIPAARGTRGVPRGSDNIVAPQRKMCRPNVHSALHFYDICQQYASTANVLTFQSEDRHRVFKSWVTHTNHRDVCKTLLEMECRQRTLRLVLDGAYRDTHLAHTKAIGNVDYRRPTLLRFTRVNTTVDVDYDAPGDTLVVESGWQMKEARLIAPTRPSADTTDRLLSVQHNHRLGHTHPFNMALGDAYRAGYSKAAPVRSFGSKRVHWAKRLSFKLKGEGARHVFSVGDFIRFGDKEAGIIEGISSHFHHDTKWAFVVVREADGDFSDQGVAASIRGPIEGDERDWDPVLKLRQFTMSLRRRIIALPKVRADRLWVVPTNEEGVFWFVGDRIQTM